MVYSIDVEQCGPGEYDVYVAGHVAGIVAATATINTPMPWRFEDKDSNSVPACGN